MSVFGVILVRIFPHSAEYGKMRTRITPNTDTFYEVLCVCLKIKLLQRSINFPIGRFYFFLKNAEYKAVRSNLNKQTKEFPKFDWH